MKYIKSLTALIFTILLPMTAFAQESVPENPAEKIKWAIENSSTMPKPMIVGLVLLAAMIVITILLYHMKGDDSK